jgi:two-component system, chemotaxis family, protein-glutamate methylesterase/glutaminase
MVVDTLRGDKQLPKHRTWRGERAMNKAGAISRDIVAIGGSAGALDALEQLLMRFPSDLPAAVLLVLHRPVQHNSFLREILARATRMPIAIAHEGQRLEHGICYLGTPDRHLMVGPGPTFHLLPDGFYRAHNIDALFQSLAYHAGPRVIGVVLSGLLKDGSLGLRAIKDAGGLTMVQSPDEAPFKEMPRNAIKHDGIIDFIGPVDALAERICRAVSPDESETLPRGGSETVLSGFLT